MENFSHGVLPNLVQDHQPVVVAFFMSSIGIIKLFNTYGLSQEHEITCPHKEPVTHISSAAIDQSPFIAASFGSKKYMVIWGSHDNQWHFKIFPPKDPHDGPVSGIPRLSYACDVALVGYPSWRAYLINTEHLIPLH